jgi:hypothetical protein
MNKKKRAQVPPAVPMPQQVSVAPAQAPTVPATAAPEDAQQGDRRSEVREVISQLSQLIRALSQSIFQIELKDDQVKELAQKVLQELTKTVGDVTTERVKQIAGDFLIVEALKKQGRKVHAVNSVVVYQLNPFVTIPATVKGIKLQDNKPVYDLEVDKKYVAKYGFEKNASNVMAEKIAEKPHKIRG